VLLSPEEIEASRGGISAAASSTEMDVEVAHTVNVSDSIDAEGNIVRCVVVSEDPELVVAMTDENGRPRNNAACEAMEEALAGERSSAPSLPQVQEED